MNLTASPNPMARLVLKILRIALGFLLVLSAGPFLIQGGLSRYAMQGMTPHPDRRMLAMGLIMALSGVLLLRPLPWRPRHLIGLWGRRPRG